MRGVGRAIIQGQTGGVVKIIAEIIVITFLLFVVIFCKIKIRNDLAAQDGKFILIMEIIQKFIQMATCFFFYFVT